MADRDDRMVGGILAFEVYGVPQPKGSTRSFGYLTLDASGEQVIRTKTIGDNSKNGTWQRDVGFTALAAMTRSDPRFRRINDGAVSVSVDFYLPRPKYVKARAVPHVTKPDVDKLLRAILDALTGVVWRDDAQVNSTRATKSYVDPGGNPRAAIAVWGSAPEVRDALL